MILIFRFARKKGNPSVKLLLHVCIVSILIVTPFNQVYGNENENYNTSVINSDPALFTLGVQVGDWREYNFTILYNPSESFDTLYIEEGQKFLVEVRNVTDLFYKYTIKKFRLNGSIFGTTSHCIVPRDVRPSYTEYVTTTNLAFLEQSLKTEYEKRKITYQVKGQELLVHWVRNSTTNSNHEENHSFSEVWSIDLTTGWRNYYTNILIDKGVLKRHIVVEVIRSNTMNNRSSPQHAPPLSGLQIFNTTASLFFVGIVVIIIRRYKIH